MYLIPESTEIVYFSGCPFKCLSVCLPKCMHQQPLQLVKLEEKRSRKSVRTVSPPPPPPFFLSGIVGVADNSNTQYWFSAQDHVPCSIRIRTFFFQSIPVQERSTYFRFEESNYLCIQVKWLQKETHHYHVVLSHSSCFITPWPLSAIDRSSSTSTQTLKKSDIGKVGLGTT